MATVWLGAGGPVLFAEAPGTFRDGSGQTNAGPALLIECGDGDRVVLEAHTPEVLLDYLDLLRDQVLEPATSCRRPQP